MGTSARVTDVYGTKLLSASFSPSPVAFLATWLQPQIEVTSLGVTPKSESLAREACFEWSQSVGRLLAERATRISDALQGGKSYHWSHRQSTERIDGVVIVKGCPGQSALTREDKCAQPLGGSRGYTDGRPSLPDILVQWVKASLKPLNLQQAKSASPPENNSAVRAVHVCMFVLWRSL